MIKSRKKIAVFAGSFDPFTLGHYDIVERASKIFNTVWILVSQNANKNYMFDLKFRTQMVRDAVNNLKNVKVIMNEGLTVALMKTFNAEYLVRGIRGSNDIEFEQMLFWNNKILYPESETIFLMSKKEHLAISSSAVRELIKSCSVKDLKKVLVNYIPSKNILKLLKEFGC